MMKAIIALPLLGFVVQATSLEDRYLKSEGERRDNNETLELILKNSRTVELSASEERGNQTFHMALPCSYLENSNEDAKKPQTVIQEATSSLLAAKALVKTMLSKHDEDGDERTLDATAWEFLDALLLLPATDDLFFQSLGLLPKYWYASPAESSDFQSNAYIPNTRFPSWSLFGGKIPETEVDNHIHLLQSSHRLTTVPLYASIVWDMLLCAIPPEDTKNYTIAILEQKSSRGKDADIETKSSNGNHYTYHYDSNKDFWDKLDAYFNRIYEHHFYIHTVVMRGCFDGREMLVNSNSSIPCYNILHPWESLMDPTSPSWEIALQGTIKSMKKTNWKVPFRIPDLVRQSYDFPQNSQVYDAMIYLLEAQSKAEIPSQCQNSTSPSCAEAILLQNSPFAMLDVGYAAGK